jgi:DNA-binding IscR family transcriptional regulator
MNASSRFSVAIHVLAIIALGGGEAVTSPYLAARMNTNPTVIRRLLLRLSAARLVKWRWQARAWRLERPAREITLRDIYRAADGSPLFRVPRRAPSRRYPVGVALQSCLARHLAAATRAVENRLERTTVADIAREVKSAARVARGPR